MTQSNDTGGDVNQNDQMDELESSFQTSYRSTFSRLKQYDRAVVDAAARGVPVPQTSLPISSLKETGDHRVIERNQKQPSGSNEPPAGRHAAHHSWLLGSYGGRKKPQAVRSRGTAGSVDPVEPAGQKVETDLSLIRKIASSPGQAEKKAPHQHPDDYKIPAQALEAALPPETHEGSGELYAPTIEVAVPAAPRDPYLNRRKSEAPGPVPPDDSELKHLYMPTMDVRKPPVVPPQGAPPQGAPPQGAPPQGAPPHPPPSGVDSRAEAGGTTALPGATPSPLLPVTTPGTVPVLPGSGKPSSSAPPPLPAKKQKLSSYIDRQIGAYDEGDSDTQNDDDTGGGAAGRRKKQGSRNIPRIAVSVAAITGLAAGGMVVWQGIDSGGTSWIPFAGSGKSKQFAERADAALKNGSYTEAVGILDEAIKLDPDRSSFYQQRGLAKLQLHRKDLYDSALDDFNIALKKNPNLHEALLDRAAVRVELGQYEKAIEDYDRLIESGKDTTRVRYGLGLAKYYDGNYSEAETEFRKALKKDPTNAEATIALGTTLYKGRDDKAAAEQEFSRAAKMKGSSELASRNLATLAYEQTVFNLLRRDWQGARNSADKLIALGRWQEDTTYSAVLCKWIALKYEGRNVLAKEVLIDCRKQAQDNQWPAPVVKFLLDEIDFEELQKETKDQAEMADAYFYAGMEDFFDGNKKDARKKLEWVDSKDISENLANLLADRALEWLAPGGPDSGGGKSR